MSNLQHSIDQRLCRDIEYNDDILAKFVTEVQSHPSHAFEWSSRAMTAAARRDTAILIRDMLRAKGVGYVVDFLTTYVMQHAQWPARTGQPVANIMSSEILAAYARLALEISGIMSTRHAQAVTA